MNTAWTGTRLLTLIFVSTPVFATPIQQINVVNMLGNANATGNMPGLSATSVLVAFNNGGTQPCYSTTLAFQAYTTVLAGVGQACVAAITSVSFTPVVAPAGNIYSAPEITMVNPSYYTTELTIENQTPPTFDTTNGMLTVQGTSQVISQGQLANSLAFN